MPPFTTEPSYPQTLILFAIGESGTCKADIGIALSDVMTVGDISKQIERLVRKGLVEVGGFQKRRRAPSSRIILLTDRGRATRTRLRNRGVRR